MANVYESKFKGVEVDDGINTATYATGTGGIDVTIKGTTNVTGTSGRHLEIDGSKLETALGKKQDTITDKTSLNAATLSVNTLSVGTGGTTINGTITGNGLKVTGTTHFYQKTGWSGAPLVISSNNGDFIEAYKGNSLTQIDMLDGSYNNTVYLPTGNGTIALTSETVSSLDGKTGVIMLGTGLSISNTNVLSCTVTGGGSTGVTSIGGLTGDVNLGRGIAVSDTGEIENFTWEVTYQVEDLPNDLQEPEVYVSIITNLPRETLDRFTTSITFTQLKENFGPDSSSDDGVFILNPYGHALVDRESGTGRTAVKPLLFNETNGIVFPSLQSDSGFIYSGTNSILFTRVSIRRV